MPFTARNSFYLRISATTVLQLLLYLDPRHVDWMSNDTLERVLSALRDRIVQKLGAETNNMTGKKTSKKKREADSEKVDVFRGAGWQMAYFFRRTAHKHAVLLKDKSVHFEPFAKDEAVEAEAPETRKGKSRKRKRLSVVIHSDDEETTDDILGEEAGHLHASTSASVHRTDLSHLNDDVEDEADEAIHVKEEDPDDDDIQFMGNAQTKDQPLFQPEFDDVEDKDTKPEGKPKLKVSYTGFSIFGRTLIVIVEPYPPLVARPSVAPLEERELSTLPHYSGRDTPVEDFAAPDANRSRSRSASTAVGRSTGRPLFRPETPRLDEDENTAQGDDLEHFRMRSQSIFSIADPEAQEDDERQRQGSEFVVPASPL